LDFLKKDKNMSEDKDTLNSIDKKLDAMFRRADERHFETKLCLQKIDDDIKDLCASRDDHREKLYGNGRPGLLTDMSKIKDIVKGISFVFWGVVAFVALYAFKVIFGIK
jgi:hypothetical protein